MRIAVTGGSGKLGRHVVRRLTGSGHEVVNLDREGERSAGFMRVDLTDYGQVVDALSGARDGDPPAPVEALVHLAAIPAPGLAPDVETFRNNIVATFSVFSAAIRLGVRTIVSASSETVLGLPFDTPPPYVPVDEEYPARPESVYSLVKHLEEQLAIELCRWHPDLKIVALRFSNVMDVEDYEAFPFDANPADRKWNLWSYIDGRDGAQAVERALEFRDDRIRPLHHRLTRHRDDSTERRAARRGLPGRRATRRYRPEHDAPVDRQSASPARVRSRVLVARHEGHHRIARAAHTGGLSRQRAAGPPPAPLRASARPSRSWSCHEAAAGSTPRRACRPGADAPSPALRPAQRRRAWRGW